MTTEPTNDDRAEWAKEALSVFTARTFNGDHPDTMNRDDLECAISDLIADLLHYASGQHFDTAGLVNNACYHFDCELRDETVPLAREPRRAYREISIGWSTEDVQSVRPDLDDEQAWTVLKRCERLHDCELGFTWLLIETVADDMFPPSEKDEAEAGI